MFCIYEVAWVLRVKINSKITSEDFCLANSATTHMILKDKKYFQSLILCKANVNTILGSSNLIEGFGRAIIMLSKGTKLYIDDALYSSKFSRNLLSFKDIRYILNDGVGSFSGQYLGPSDNEDLGPPKSFIFVCWWTGLSSLQLY